MKLASLLKIRPDEGRLVLLVALLFAFIQGGQGFGDNAASALFLLRYGVDFLPYMYMFLGGLTFITTLAYSAGLGRFERGRFFSALVFGLILLLIAERAALFLALPILYPIVWLTINCLGMILGTLVWNIAGEVCEARQAKRLFPLFASAGILGSVLGNLITGPVANLLGTVNLLLLYAVVLGVVYLLVRKIARSHFRMVQTSTKHTSILGDLRAGFDYVRGSSLMRITALASVLFSILFFSIAFPFNKVVSASFTDEAQVAGFFGVFDSLTTLATFLVSLLLANRLYARIGIVNSVLIMPLTYLLAFIVFTAAFSLSGAVMARAMQLVILSGLTGTAWNALFNVVPSQKRGQVLAFNNGVPSQVGVALSGLLLILGDKILATSQIFLMGILVTSVCAVLIWRMRAAYGQALVEALRAGRLEVFASDQPAFAGLQGDAAAFDVVQRALNDPKPATRRLAAEIIGKMQNPSAIPELTLHLTDPAPEVRAAAIHSLGELRADSAIDTLVRYLDDPDDDVRLQTLIALSQFQPQASADILNKLSEKLDDVSFEVRKSAAVLLSQLGREGSALDRVQAWLRSEDGMHRRTALDALGQMNIHLRGSLDPGLVLPALEDPSVEIRLAGCRALLSFQDEAATAALIMRLSDPQASVRETAAHVLRQRGDHSRLQVLALLESSDNYTRDAALDALSPEDHKSSTPLRLTANAEIERLRDLRMQSASLSKITREDAAVSSRALALLNKVIQDQIGDSESRLVKIVGLIGDARTMELVRKSLAGSNAETRAAALEALETLGDKQLSGRIISIMEEEPVRMQPGAVLGMIIQHGSRWQKALALQAVGELGLRELIHHLQDHNSSGDDLIRQTSIHGLKEFGEAVMETLQTVSIMERVLLLRDVPIFAQLPPEDLERLALIAREQWYPAQTVLYRQGDPGDELCVIVNGHVRVINEAGVDQRILARRGPGDFVGEMAILDAQPRMATLITETEVRVLAIDGEAFKGILRERPSVSLAVLKSLSGRLRELSQ